MSLYKFYKAVTRKVCVKIFFILRCLDIYDVLEQMLIIGPGSLTISLVTAFFVSMVFALQVAKELLYLNAINLVGSILTIAFVRELSPVLISVIIIGRVGSSFTAELATMKVTEQVDALYLLNTNPIVYLVFPRVTACIIMLPILNFLSLATSIASSAFICFELYSIDPKTFFISSFAALSLIDLFKSLLKTLVFAIVISIISCYWGLSTKGGAKGVGSSTTSSVVISLLSIFILDFILSYLMFHDLGSIIQIS